jgi:hypothetical protein
MKHVANSRGKPFQGNVPKSPTAGTQTGGPVEVRETHTCRAHLTFSPLREHECV